MEAFQGVFTKRGETEASCTSTGAFEDVFVRRGRWRKSLAETDQQSNSNAANDDVACPNHYSSARCDAAESADSCKTLHQFNIKNTFVNTVLDFDSLQDFLKERQVKSCPASRQGSGMTTMLLDDLLAKSDLETQAGSKLREEVLNTASSLGDVAFMLVTQKEDDAISVPSGSTVSGDSESTTNEEVAGDSESNANEEVLNTASTFADLGLEIAQGVEETNLENGPGLNDEALRVTAQDRLRSLRLTGSAIHQRISPNEPQAQEVHPVSTAGTGAVSCQQPPMQAPNQWLVAVQTAEGIRPGVVTLLGSLQPEQQMPLTTPRLSDPAPVQPTAMPIVAPPPTAPVLRLADSIAPPEKDTPELPSISDLLQSTGKLGTEELPSIGSLLHGTGGCKPCTFFHTRGCENKEDCKFCHLCGPREKKKRLKAQKAVQRQADFEALQNGLATLARFRAAEEPGNQIDMIVE